MRTPLNKPGTLLLALLLAAVMLPGPAHAAAKGRKDKKKSEQPAPKKPTAYEKLFKDKECKTADGLFKLHLIEDEDYTVHEITLGPGCNVPGYAGTTIGYISTLPTSQAKRWTNEQPRIDIYIDQIMTVSGVANSSGFALAALLNANIELGNDPIIGIEAYPGTAEIHAKMGYNVIPGDEDAPLKRMTLQPSSLPELFELKNGEWNYIGK